MAPFTLTPSQIELLKRPLDRKIFLEGPAGSGKTTVGVYRVLSLLNAGVPASTILLLVPQRTLAGPYHEALSDPAMPPGGKLQAVTVGGLARRMVELFWPLVAEEAGFARPDHPPSFLTLETALYYMAYLVRPLLEGGAFDSVTIDRNRIYSQILDNLNKAAFVGFPHTEIGERLREAWIDSTAQANVLADAQRCANLFREYCLQNNLLDFSLQMEIFFHYLWPADLCRAYLRRTYHHLVVDNLEEDTPVAHDILREWLPDFQSALLIYDQEAGFRRFLGADPDSAITLGNGCDEHHIFTGTLVTSPALAGFAEQLCRVLERDPVAEDSPQEDGRRKPLLRETLARRDPQTGPNEGGPPLTAQPIKAAIDYPEKNLRFFPQMLDWVVERVTDLLDAGVPPHEIVLLAPFLPDALRFALANRLEGRGIPYRSHRPSRSLREEPAAQALLTLAALAHPHWGLKPSSFEVAYAFIQAIEGLDLVRAQLLTEAVYTSRTGMPYLTPFERVGAEIRERVSYGVGNRYERLRVWLTAYAQDPDRPPDTQETELDFFFSRLFGEVLSQPGFGFHANLDAGRISANLIESAQKFRWAVQGRLPASSRLDWNEALLGQEYVQMIEEGVLAAQYVQSWQAAPGEGVLLAPAYTFLLSNQPVDHQFWLDVGSTNWSARLLQPLTHPVVLSRRWRRGQVWTDANEVEYARDTLYRLTLGLLRRCRVRVHLAYCELNEGGFESRGMLLRAVQQVLQQSREGRA